MFRRSRGKLIPIEVKSGADGRLKSVEGKPYTVNYLPESFRTFGKVSAYHNDYKFCSYTQSEKLYLC
ncbi:hypothetical protein FHS57_005568 [Runella defluvii]|uniref:Uncharacterized protein n=1 Tax=Runella defluvii TaxID=370973 RepID=A0A7W5ZRQ6_9BACT|nr:hypothetical protein [Runella defluvii]